MRIRDLPIRVNLALLVLSASALAVLLASVGFAVYERHSDRASAVHELTALADTLGTNTAASLAFDDQNTATQMLAALATEPHILAAGLYDGAMASLPNIIDPGAFPGCRCPRGAPMALPSTLGRSHCFMAYI